MLEYYDDHDGMNTRISYKNRLNVYGLNWTNHCWIWNGV